MKTEFTKEEWIREGNFIYALVQDGWNKGKPQMVNKFWLSVDGHKNISAEEKEANAKLIAAAPELLEMCINLLDIVDTRSQGDHDICDMAEKAIKKATV